MIGARKSQLHAAESRKIVLDYIGSLVAGQPPSRKELEVSRSAEWLLQRKVDRRAVQKEIICLLGSALDETRDRVCQCGASVLPEVYMHWRRVARETAMVLVSLNLSLKPEIRKDGGRRRGTILTRYIGKKLRGIIHTRKNALLDDVLGDVRSERAREMAGLEPSGAYGQIKTKLSIVKNIKAADEFQERALEEARIQYRSALDSRQCSTVAEYIYLLEAYIASERGKPYLRDSMHKIEGMLVQLGLQSPYFTKDDLWALVKGEHNREVELVYNFYAVSEVKAVLEKYVEYIVSKVLGEGSLRELVEAERVFEEMRIFRRQEFDEIREREERRVVKEREKAMAVEVMELLEDMAASEEKVVDAKGRRCLIRSLGLILSMIGESHSFESMLISLVANALLAKVSIGNLERAYFLIEEYLPGRTRRRIDGIIREYRGMVRYDTRKLSKKGRNGGRKPGDAKELGDFEVDFLLMNTSKWPADVNVRLEAHVAHEIEEAKRAIGMDYNSDGMRIDWADHLAQVDAEISGKTFTLTLIQYLALRRVLDNGKIDPKELIGASGDLKQATQGRIVAPKLSAAQVKALLRIHMRPLVDHGVISKQGDHFVLGSFGEAGANLVPRHLIYQKQESHKKEASTVSLFIDSYISRTLKRRRQASKEELYKCIQLEREGISQEAIERRVEGLENKGLLEDSGDALHYIP